MATSVEGSHFPVGTWEESLLEWSSFLFTILLFLLLLSPYLGAVPFSDFPCSLLLLLRTAVVSLPSLISCPCSQGFPSFCLCLLFPGLPLSVTLGLTLCFGFSELIHWDEHQDQFPASGSGAALPALVSFMGREDWEMGSEHSLSLHRD